MKKVKVEVMKPWIANWVTELVGFEDEVLINFITTLLDNKARGLKKLLKRLNASKHWMLDKLGGSQAICPHKSRECFPFILILRNRLKYARTYCESIVILMQRHVLVDGKVISCLMPDPMKRDYLIVENTPDPLAVEQTWPTEAEMAEAYKIHQEKKLSHLSEHLNIR